MGTGLISSKATNRTRISTQRRRESKGAKGSYLPMNKDIFAEVIATLRQDMQDD